MHQSTAPSKKCAKSPPVSMNLSCLSFSVPLLYFLTHYLSVPLIMSALSGDLFPPRAPTPSQSSIRLHAAEFLWERVGGYGGLL